MEIRRPEASCPSVAWMSPGLSGPEQRGSVQRGLRGASSRNWAALGLRVHAASLLHSTGVRLAGAAFTPAPEGALLCPASPPGPESWAGSRGGWASGPSAEPSLPLRSGTAARSLMCHRTLYWRETKEEDVMKGFDDWVVPPHGVTAGEGPVCSSF